MLKKINIPPFLFALIMVPVGGNFQAALDQARPGDEVVLPASSSFIGSFTLPKKADGPAITIRTDGDMAKILSPGQNLPALTTAPGAANYVIKNIEFAKATPDAK